MKTIRTDQGYEIYTGRQYYAVRNLAGPSKKPYWHLALMTGEFITCTNTVREAKEAIISLDEKNTIRPAAEQHAAVQQFVFLQNEGQEKGIPVSAPSAVSRCPCGADGPHCDLQTKQFVLCRCGREFVSQSLRGLAKKLNFDRVEDRTHNYNSANES